MGLLAAPPSYRPPWRADQTELITVGSGGYGTDWLLAGWLMQPRTRIPLEMRMMCLMIDPATHAPNKDDRQTASLLDEYVNPHTASRMMTRRINQSIDGFFSTLHEKCRTAARSCVAGVALDPVLESSKWRTRMAISFLPLTLFLTFSEPLNSCLSRSHSHTP